MLTAPTGAVLGSVPLVPALPPWQLKADADWDAPRPRHKSSKTQHLTGQVVSQGLHSAAPTASCRPCSLRLVAFIGWPVRTYQLKLRAW
jgi:hypothetical protein